MGAPNPGICCGSVVVSAGASPEERFAVRFVRDFFPWPEPVGVDGVSTGVSPSCRSISGARAVIWSTRPLTVDSTACSLTASTISPVYGSPGVPATIQWLWTASGSRAEFPDCFPSSATEGSRFFTTAEADFQGAPSFRSTRIPARVIFRPPSAVDRAPSMISE